MSRWGTWWVAAKGAFVLAVCVFAVLGFRGRSDDVREAMVQVSLVNMALALLLVCAGLGATAIVWRIALSSFGHRLDRRAGRAIFFVGQLGKYLPGSLWSFAAQAAMARPLAVSPRTTMTSSLVLVGMHVTTGAAVAGAGGTASHVIPFWAGVALVSGGVGGSLPLAVTAVAGVFAGVRPHWRWGDTARVWCAMLVAWMCYAAALVVLVPGASWGQADLFAFAFASAFVAGVLVPLAPAGVGVREVVLVALLQPTFGLTACSALAVLARLAHTVADFLAAGVSWGCARYAPVAPENDRSGDVGGAWKRDRHDDDH